MNWYTKIRSNTFPMILLGVIIYFTYERLPRTFFQQDEWWSFGAYIFREKTGGVAKVLLDSFIVSGKVHFSPLTAIAEFLQFKLFGLSFPGYAYVSIVIHFINTLLVYFLAVFILKRCLISFLIAILFATSSIAHQTVSWISGSTQTQGATLFSLLSVVFILRYLSDSNKRGILFYFSLGSVFMALLFKETALPFFLLPALFFFYSKDKSMRFTKKIFFIFGVSAILYLVIRGIIWFLAPPIELGTEGVLLQPNFTVHLYRLFMLPFKVLPESVFPMGLLLAFSRNFIRLAYPQFIDADGSPNPYIIETAGLDYVNYLLSALLIVLGYLCYRIFKEKQKNELITALILSPIIIIASTVLIIFIPGHAGYASIIEPRHLYGASFGSSLFIVLFLTAVSLYVSKGSNVQRFVVVFPLIMLMFIHIKLVRRDLQALEDVSNIRKSFLVTMSKDYPKLPKQVVFYTQSDRPYYGMAEEERILPVQIGFGRMLLVWYQHAEKFPTCFYAKSFLLDLLTQGFLYCDGRGFGYFRQYDKMVQTMRENHLRPDDVIAYSWRGFTNEFTNTTSEIQKRLTVDMPYAK